MFSPRNSTLLPSYIKNYYEKSYLCLKFYHSWNSMPT